MGLRLSALDHRLGKVQVEPVPVLGVNLGLHILDALLHLPRLGVQRPGRHVPLGNSLVRPVGAARTVDHTGVVAVFEHDNSGLHSAKVQVGELRAARLLDCLPYLVIHDPDCAGGK